MHSEIEKLFCTELFRIHRRQMLLLQQTNGASYTFQKATGALTFADGSVLTSQLLGLETPDKMWRWAWDSDELNPAITSAARAVKTEGAARGLNELVAGLLSVKQLLCAGHTLAAVATVFFPRHGYFRCVQPDGMAVYVLVTGIELPDDVGRLDRDTVRQAISDMFADYAQADDFLTLRSAMAVTGFTVEETASQVIGRRGEDPPMVFERSWFS